MTSEQAMDRLNVLLAHAWMVRTFLKHAEEIQQDEELQEVHRMIFDYVRALEPSFQHQDVKEYLHRARGKLPKVALMACMHKLLLAIYSVAKHRRPFVATLGAARAST